MKPCKAKLKSIERSKCVVQKNNNKFGKRMSQQEDHMLVPNGTGPGARTSKRPLSACPARRKCSMAASNNSAKGRVRRNQNGNYKFTHKLKAL